MRKLVPVIALALGAATASSALAQETRYTIERSGERLVRMDGRTGEVSICEERGSELVCRMAADERDALEQDIDAMAARIEALEARIAALEAGRPAASSGLPSEDEVESAFSLMERFFRRFIGVIRDIERDFGREDPAPGLPERT